jgi:hypothetical protein
MSLHEFKNELQKCRGVDFLGALNVVVEDKDRSLQEAKCPLST